MADILEQLKEEWEHQSRRSFEAADGGIAANLLQGAIDEIETLRTAAQFSDEQIDRAAIQLFRLDNPIARWPTVNQVAYRREAKSILDAAHSRS